MPSHLRVQLIPALNDNYIFLVRSPFSKEVCVVDPAVSEPVLSLLRDEQLTLKQVLITHHHHDHVGGVQDLKQKTGFVVVGSRYDRSRLPPLDVEVVEGDVVPVLGVSFRVWHLPGHTSGHISYFSDEERCAFTGDVLFGLGCGRLFEGTWEEMFLSLGRLKTLDPRTAVYCAHEYAEHNLAFARQVLPDNIAIRARAMKVHAERERGASTVPLTIGEECLTNPFLLAHDVGAFEKLRRARNEF